MVDIPGHTITAIEPLPGGVLNRVYRVSVKGAKEPLVLRIFERDPSACAKEVALHRLLQERVRVPEITDAGSGWLLMRFVPGVTFRDLKQCAGPEELAEAARSMGLTLAAIGSFQFEKPGRIEGNLEIGAPLMEGLDPAPRFVEQCLNSPVLARRIPPELRERISKFIWQCAPRLRSLDVQTRLVHSDFGSPNLIFARASGGWRVTAVLDWEFAFSGAPLCDVAHALRYERSGSPRLEPHFSDAFRQAGGELPEDWRELGRAIDFTALCEILTRPALPEQAAQEIAGLIAATVDYRRRQYPA